MLRRRGGPVNPKTTRYSGVAVVRIATCCDGASGRSSPPRAARSTDEGPSSTLAPPFVHARRPVCPRHGRGCPPAGVGSSTARVFYSTRLDPASLGPTGRTWSRMAAQARIDRACPDRPIRSSLRAATGRADPAMRSSARAQVPSDPRRRRRRCQQVRRARGHQRRLTRGTGRRRRCEPQAAGPRRGSRPDRRTRTPGGLGKGAGRPATQRDSA